VQVVDDVYHFFIQLGDTLYHLTLDCVHAVVQAAEFVFNKIKTFFEDLIKWLGFLFQWSDILRTHNVLKNLFTQYTARAIANLGTVKTDITTAFANIEKEINNWAHIPDAPGSIASYSASATPVPGQNSPQSNYGLHHTKSNLSSLTTAYAPSGPGGDDLFSELAAMLEKEGDAIKTAFQEIKSQIIDQFATLSATEIIQKLVAIIGDLLLNTVENVLITAVDILEALAKGLLDAFTATISIPILSPLYKSITGNDLSMLDLACLIVAIPATLIYKLIKEEAPYPDNATTTALIAARDFAALQDLVASGAPAPAPSHARMVLAAQSQPLAPGWTNTAFILNLTAFSAAPVLWAVSFVKWTLQQATPSPPPSTPLNFLAAVLYLPYVGPDIAEAVGPGPTSWYVIMNDAVTGVAIVKTLVDNINPVSKNETWSTIVSPWLETLINVTWMAPAIGGVVPPATPQASDWVDFASNMAFDLGGATTPATLSAYYPYLDPADQKIAALAAWGVSTGLGYGSYGILSVAYGSLKLAGK
jgi:hypothetical protein